MEPPAARLEVLSGKGAGMSVLVVDELLIGRNAEGAGRLADDDEISRTHARVTVDSGGRCVIEDLGSTNGTFVNGRRISEPQSLAVGDKLELGATVLLVQDLPAPPVSPMTEREVPTAQPTGTVRVEPTVINAPLPEVPPDAVGVAPTAVPEPDAVGVAPTAVPEPDAVGVAPTAVPEPDAVGVAPTAVPEPDAAGVAPAAVPEPDAVGVAPTPAKSDALVVAPTAVPEPAQPDAPDLPPSPVAPPPSLHLEVDFEAGEVRITSGDSEPVRLVFRDGSWQSETG